MVEYNTFPIGKWTRAHLDEFQRQWDKEEKPKRLRVIALVLMMDIADRLVSVCSNGLNLTEQHHRAIFDRVKTDAISSWKMKHHDLLRGNQNYPNIDVILEIHDRKSPKILPLHDLDNMIKSKVESIYFIDETAPVRRYMQFHNPQRYGRPA